MSRRPAGCPTSIPAGRWSSLWRESIAGVEDATEMEALLVERMVLNLMAANAALEEARTSPIVTGSKGQEVEHPGFKAAARCEDRAMAIARQLRLTPGARSDNGDDDDETPPLSAFDQLDDEVAQARERRRRS